MNSFASSQLSLHLWITWSGFLRLFFKMHWRFQMRPLQILNQTSRRPMTNLMDHILKRQRPTNTMSLKLFCSAYACIIRSLLEERNSVSKDGQENSTSTMVTWLSAVMCCTTTFPVMNWYHTLIFNICMVRSCMVVTLQTTMIDVSTILTSKSWLDLKSSRTWISLLLLASGHQILRRMKESSMSVTLINCHQRSLSCSVSIQMLKSAIWLHRERPCSSPFCNAPAEAEVEEENLRTKSWKRWSLDS